MIWVFVFTIHCTVGIHMISTSRRAQFLQRHPGPLYVPRNCGVCQQQVIIVVLLSFLFPWISGSCNSFSHHAHPYASGQCVCVGDCTFLNLFGDWQFLRITNLICQRTNNKKMQFPPTSHHSFSFFRMSWSYSHNLGYYYLVTKECSNQGNSWTKWEEGSLGTGEYFWGTFVVVENWGIPGQITGTLFLGIYVWRKMNRR